MKNEKYFISYSRSDSQIVKKIAADLKSSGINIWIDSDISVGSIWDNEIEKALQECNCLLLILSQASVNSQNVLDEVNYAIENNKKVFPIKITDCNIPYRLRRFQHIDLTSEYKINTVLAAISGKCDQGETKIESNQNIDQYEEAKRCLTNDNYKQALKLFKQSAEGGNSNAMFELAWMYISANYYEIAPNPDFDSATEWLRKAIELGNSDAMVRMATNYLVGCYGQTKNYSKAARWYTRAAELGNPCAMENLASMYEQGLGVNQDYRKALEWLKNAANTNPSGYTRRYEEKLKEYDRWGYR